MDLKNSTAYARMARISSSQAFLCATQICIWWTRLKQQPKPQTINEKKKKGYIVDIWQ